MSEGVSTPQTTASQWDAHAKDYAALFAPLTGYVARSMVTIVQDRLPDAARLLDIARGPGDPSVAAAKLCARRRAGWVMATDISRLVLLQEISLRSW